VEALPVGITEEMIQEHNVFTINWVGTNVGPNWAEEIRKNLATPEGRQDTIDYLVDFEKSAEAVRELGKNAAAYVHGLVAEALNIDKPLETREG